MSALEESQTNAAGAAAAPQKVVKPQSSASLLTRALDLLSSVRFGVTLLILLVVACMIGMLVMQQNVDGFAKYYAELTPSQQLLYGKLGFFDIYHAWYFNALLLVLSLNIILASIDHFPKAWTYVSRKKLDASATWLRGQQQSAEMTISGESREAVAARIAEAARAVGLKARVTEKNGRTFVFAERGAWNRLGAYAVHVALLTIFTGAFVTAQFARTGSMWLTPGHSASQMFETQFELDQPRQVKLQLPFQVTCTDIQQRLTRTDGPINAGNTIDWLTRIRIKDETGEREALVHMNKPYDYRGYRFFQASFVPTGRARRITVRMTPQAGGPAQDVVIARDGAATLADGTRVEFAQFNAEFSAGGADDTGTDTSDYRNPAATLTVTPPGGQPQQAFAFTPQMAERAPIARNPVAGYTYLLIDFEKVADAHMLSIQNDPGANVVYVGFALLGLTLCAVFFFSHQRVWALIEPAAEGTHKIILGGNTNRNKLNLEDRFKRLINSLGGAASVPREAKES